MAREETGPIVEGLSPWQSSERGKTVIGAREKTDGARNKAAIGARGNTIIDVRGKPVTGQTNAWNPDPCTGWTALS